jgi:acetyltransferase-like isoleucine patch superfamily enzyme
MPKTFALTRIIGEAHIQFGDPVIIDDFVMIYAKHPMRIGNYVHIGAFSSVVAGDWLEMGDFSTLSHGCRVFTRSDDFKHAGFGNPTVPEAYRNIRHGPVVIGRFCVVGANSVILPNVTIGEGATVGANSVVSRDLAPWGVYRDNQRIAERDRAGVLTNFGRFLAEQGPGAAADPPDPVKEVE